MKQSEKSEKFNELRVFNLVFSIESRDLLSVGIASGGKLHYTSDIRVGYDETCIVLSESTSNDLYVDSINETIELGLSCVFSSALKTFKTKSHYTYIYIDKKQWDAAISYSLSHMLKEFGPLRIEKEQRYFTCGKGTPDERKIKIIDSSSVKLKGGRLAGILFLDDGSYVLRVLNELDTGRAPDLSWWLSKESLLGLLFSVSSMITKQGVDVISQMDELIDKTAYEQNPTTDEKHKPKNKYFKIPTISDLVKYAKEFAEKRGALFPDEFLTTFPVEFLDYYNSNGWKVGRNKMKSWEFTANRWLRKGLSELQNQ